jgi:hypothetical protein
MLLEHFDKCSDLKNFTDKNITDKDLDGVSSEDIDKCSQLNTLINDHNIDLKLYNTITIDKLDNPLDYIDINKLDIGKFLDFKDKSDVKGIQIYVFIIIAFVVNIYLGLFITPFLLGGSALISLFIILLSALILFLLIYLFS